VDVCLILDQFGELITCPIQEGDGATGVAALVGMAAEASLREVVFPLVAETLVAVGPVATGERVLPLFMILSPYTLLST
jgi:hypothetical protein